MDLTKCEFIHSCTELGSIPMYCLRAHLYRHRVERSFSVNEQLKSRFIRGKEYGNVALFVEDHRNVLQLVIIWQCSIYMLADSRTYGGNKYVCMCNFFLQYMLKMTNFIQSGI